MTLEQLNKAFGIPSQVEIVEGKGGFPLIAIHNEQAKAKISIYSGQVISFQPVGESADLMFVSENAYYQSGKAIKGGIPICWPWFGPDPEGRGRASHGFVRNRMWTLLSTEATPAGATKVKLGVSANEETETIWPYRFELVIEIVVGTQLSVALITQNTGDEAFSITQALHTYLAVGDITQVQVLGLDDTPYLDKADGGVKKTQTGAITIIGETDRIYEGVNPELLIEDGALGRRIRIATVGSSTAIVWNPWQEISMKMADLADKDYQQFICVETANAADEVIEILPGGAHQMQAVYTVERG
ncbi:MAG: D-hexose-6-phosphate mutarotase [Phormidesmis sp. RL_2_1]|nr:D-hexose-6-phosphate mutarotase [Phormidesmis sp. RL_2_1]